jgi:hypothetical protein
MSPIITNALVAFIVLFFITTLIEFLRKHYFKRFLFEILLIIGFIIILNITTGFPIPSSRQAFGGVSPLVAMGIMFVCTILGIMAHYFFYLKGKFSWRKFLKPLFISPIVFLPLIGSVQSISSLESIQMISFAILAFQNGFFWKEVFERGQHQV